MLTLYDRAPLVAYMKKHKLGTVAMARHAGITRLTLRRTLRERNSTEPKPGTIAALDRAIASPPPRIEPKVSQHAKIIREHWGQIPSEEIGWLCGERGISGGRVRQIAGKLGLPPDPR